VITDGGGIDALPGTGALEGQLALTIEHIAYLLPVYQVLALEDGHTWEILEGGVDEIERVAHPADGRVWVETWDNRILITLC